MPVAREGLDLLFGLDVPQHEGLVLGARAEKQAVWGEGQAGDRVLVPFEGRFFKTVP